jgi:hypothetical protein
MPWHQPFHRIHANSKFKFRRINTQGGRPFPFALRVKPDRKLQTSATKLLLLAQ